MKRFAILVTVAALATPAFANLLSNGDFEADAIITGDQTVVGDDETKLIDPSLADKISGVQDWLGLSPSDHGLTRENDLGGSDTQQFAFINNWNRRMSQTVAEVVQEGVTYVAEIDYAHNSNMTTEEKSGEFYLYAGTMDSPDSPAADAVELGMVRAGNSLWDGDPLDVVVDAYEWVTLRIEYTAQAGDPAIGKPLTVSFRTDWGSGGPNFFDNAVLTPEPASLLVLALGGLMIRRR